jgi:hypothetical protein
MTSGAPVLEKVEIDDFAAKFTETNWRDMATVSINPVIQIQFGGLLARNAAMIVCLSGTQGKQECH